MIRDRINDFGAFENLISKLVLFHVVLFKQQQKTFSPPPLRIGKLNEDLNAIKEKITAMAGD